MPNGDKSMLHQILAVESEVEGEATKIIEEAYLTFTKRTHHFSGHHKQLQMFDEARQKEAEAAEEKQEMVTTVPAKLRYVSKAIARWFDVLLQKESTNQSARANLKVGEREFGELPATFLLGMESRLKKVRSLIESVPTQAPGIRWDKDESLDENAYRMHEPEKRAKTERKVEYKILQAPTKEHRAEIEKWNVDTPVGTFITERWTGLITPLQKSQMLSRCDELVRAVKQARMEANTAEVENDQVGQSMLDYILG